MATSGSVTNEPCTCDVLRRAALEPHVPIEFDSEMQEYHILHDAVGSLPRGHMMIYHCFFCGGVAPAESRRASKFADVSNTEVRRLQTLTRGIETVEEAIAKFGPPDSDIPMGLTVTTPETHDSPSRTTSYRRLVFTGLSGTADVELTDFGPPRGVRFTFVGKYLGKGSTEP